MMWTSLLSAQEAVPGVLSTPTLAGLLVAVTTALLTAIYAILRGRLRPESALKEVREDRDARVHEVREDRDARIAEAKLQIEMWKSAHDNAEASRLSQEALLRETTMEIARTVQYIIVALQEARLQAQEPLGMGNPREYGQDG